MIGQVIAKIDMAARFPLQDGKAIPTFGAVTVCDYTDPIVVDFGHVELRHGIAGLCQPFQRGNGSRIAGLVVGTGCIGIVQGDQTIDRLVEMHRSLRLVS